LYPAFQKEEQHTVEPDREQQHKQRRSAASSLSGIVDTVLDLADTQAYEEQQQLIQRRKKRKLHR
jgi:CHASE3 domain sensor protein